MNKKNLMFMGISDKFILDVAQSISKNINITMVSGGDIHRSYFPNAEIINPGLHPGFYRKNALQSKYSLSKKIIEEMRGCEIEFLSISDRFSYWNVSVIDRKQFFYDILLYWYGIIKSRSIDVVYMHEIAHMGIDTVLFHLLKYLNIPVVNLIPTTRTDLAMLSEDYRNLPELPMNYLKNKTHREIQETIDVDILEDALSESNDLKYLRTLKVKDSSSNIFSIASLRLLLSLFKNLVNSKKTSLSEFGFYGPITYRYLSWVNLQKRVSDYFLYKYYLSLTKSYIRECKYIYFPLPVQPERTSLPMAGVFNNVILAIDILSKSLPDGWVLYVKEHPSLYLLYRYDNKQFRDKEFYERISKMKNVKLLDSSVSSEVLIENSKAVAVLTSSTGWEALHKGIPCLVFGHPWYVKCHSCYAIDSLSSTNEAIDKIVNNTTPEGVLLDQIRFLAFYQKFLVKTTQNYYLAKQSNKNYSFLVKNLSESIEERISKILSL